MRSNLRALLLASLITLALAGCEGSSPADPSDTSSDAYGTLEQAAYEKVNDHRASQGLPRLAFDATIAAQARAHSRNMAQGRTAFGHDGFDARVDAISKTITVRSAGENVAVNGGFSDPASEAVRGWLNSPGHLENIEGEYDITGIGVDKSPSGDYYFTQIFVKR